MTEDAWLKLLTNSPILAVLVALLFGLWKSAKWLAAKVVEPTIDAFKSYLNSADASMRRIADSSEKHADILVALQTSTEQKNDILTRIETTESKISGQVDDVHSDVKGIKSILERKGQ